MQPETTPSLPLAWERRSRPRATPRLSNAAFDHTTASRVAVPSPTGEETKAKDAASGRTWTGEDETQQQQLIQAQKLEAVGQLAGGIAHDFNNILGVIRGFSQFIHDDLSEDSPMRADVEEVMEAADRGSALVRQLMVFSRHDAPDLQVVHLSTAIAGMERMLEQAATEAVEIIVSIDPRIPDVEFDHVRLQQVLMNLVVNARDAMPDGGKLMIDGDYCVLEKGDVSHLPKGAYARLIVSDTGSGMSEETKDRLFDPFFTTKAKEKGTGLGLSTVYGIILQASGDIMVSSAPGAGTSFSIYLPQASAEVVSHPLQTETPERSPGFTVLLVEDDVKMAEVLTRFLEADGHDVIWAEDGFTALDLFRRTERRIDVVVSDVVMPGMTGIEMARILRETDKAPKVIFISGYPNLSSPEGDVSGEVLLLKPFSREDLQAAITRTLSTGTVSWAA